MERRENKYEKKGVITSESKNSQNKVGKIGLYRQGGGAYQGKKDQQDRIEEEYYSVEKIVLIRKIRGDEIIDKI